MSIIRRKDVLFPALMSELMNPDWFGGLERTNGNVPAVNIIENDKDYVLEMAVPGRDKGDFNIEIDDNVLTVSTQKEETQDEERKNYSRREYTISTFKRSFSLSETINEDSIEATYVNGILRFALPKKEEALPKAKRMIELA